MLQHMQKAELILFRVEFAVCLFKSFVHAEKRRERVPMREEQLLNIKVGIIVEIFWKWKTNMNEGFDTF